MDEAQSAEDRGEDVQESVGDEPTSGSVAAGEATEPARLRVHAVGLVPASLDRLRTAGAELVDDVDAAHIVVVSTRLPDETLPSPLPDGTVVLVHPEGDGRAVALLTAGARSLHHEGDEASILDTVVVSDPAEVAAAPTTDASDPDTLVVLRLGRLAGLGSRNVTSLVHRRLLIRWRALVGAVGAELHETDDPVRLTLSWPSASPNDVRALSVMLAGAAETFLPDGAAPLSFAAGVALPADGPDATARLQVATSAAELALARGNPCLTAEEALSATVTDRATATLRAAADAAERVLDAPGHGARCVSLVTAVAGRLGCSPDEVADLTRAARFHHVAVVACGEGGSCSEDTRLRAVALVRPALGAGVAQALEGSLIAACDAAETARSRGAENVPAILEAVDVAVPDLATDIRDALSASLQVGSARPVGQAVPA